MRMEIYKKYKIIKYSDIKLAKGLCLDNIQTLQRDEFDIGISTKRYGKTWQMLPKGKAIFKTYDGQSMYNQIREVRIVNELLCCELSKQVGVLCAEYELATKDDVTGLVSYDVITNKNQKLIPAISMFNQLQITCLNNFNSYMDAVKKYQQLGYKIDSKKMLCDLYKISLFDALTIQTDRHTNNIFMIVDTQKKTIKVAPLIDNELAFASGICYESLDSDCYIYPESIKNYTIMINKIIEVKRNPLKPNRYSENIKNLVELAKHNKTFDTIFKEMIQNYDIQKAISNIKSKGVEINSKYEDFLITSQAVTKKMLLEEYQKQSNPTVQNSYNVALER